ncbi:tyrosine-type recombinase/integrase [Loigolactobacillus backii]|uniref:tyrosine-type recombinase/integrase n=1 Tax=Loigolactobacillus backii TaxID=375175 RepID=UPI0007F14829|nr:site-specific integrase [Loigolactobacillus backii]ANK59855.1 hypothetical protein AYR52_06025 [Loigolactobacillus backii]
MASIKQQDNGKWRYRIRYKRDGSFKEVSKSGFKLKSQAQAAAAKLEDRLNKGINVAGGKKAIGDFMNYWLKLRQPEVKASTLTRLTYQTNKYILPTFQFVELDELTRHDCNKWIADLANRVQASTARSIISTFHSALRYAVDEDKLIDNNPLDHIKLPKINYKDKKIKFYTREQLNQLLDFMKTHKDGKWELSKQYYVLFGLLSHTGLRLGEALALKWSDINDDRLTVDENLHYDYHNNASLTTPKTESSYRTILIDKFTQDLLHQQKKNRLEVLVRYKNFKRPSGEFSDLIFYNANGNPLRHSVVRDYMKGVCKLAGVPQLSPHAFRHTHAVLLLESGANIKAVSERLGHATIDMTANVYLHVTKKMETDTIERFSNYV